MCSLILPFALYLRFSIAGHSDEVILVQEAVSSVGARTAHINQGRARCAAFTRLRRCALRQTV